MNDRISGIVAEISVFVIDFLVIPPQTSDPKEFICLQIHVPQGDGKTPFTNAIPVDRLGWNRIDVKRDFIVLRIVPGKSGIDLTESDLRFFPVKVRCKIFDIKKISFRSCGRLYGRLHKEFSLVIGYY